MKTSLTLKMVPALLATTAIIGTTSMVFAAQANTSFQIAQAGGGAADLMAKFGTPTKEVLEQGKKAYDANCAACHMADGKGNPAMKSRNFTATDGWKKGRTIDLMFDTVTSGLSGTAMAGFKHLSVDDRFAILHHIRTFADFPEIKSEEIKKIDDKYKLLSQQFKAISISKAMQIIESEAKAANDAIQQKVAKAAKQTGHGAELFNRLAYDKTKALTMLSRSNVWKSKLEDFVAMIMGSANSNGFSSRAAELSKSDWEQLQSFLSNL